MITLSRGNLVRAYSVITTISICEHALQTRRPQVEAPSIDRFVRAHNSDFTFGDDHLCIFRLPSEGRSVGNSRGNVVCFYPVEAEHAWRSSWFWYAYLIYIRPFHFFLKSSYLGDIAGELLVSKEQWIYY